MRLSREDRRFVQLVNRAFSQGRKQTDIAAELGVSPSYINAKLSRLGFKISKRAVPANDEEVRVA